MPWRATLLLVICGTCSATAAPLCLPHSTERGKIIRVETNGALVLANGQEAKLEGILLPAGRRDRAPAYLASQAIKRLAALAAGQQASLTTLQPVMDRYGRIRAQIILKNSRPGVWLQQLLLSEGLARVDIAPDRRECASEMFSAEQRARAARLGLWSSVAYRLRTPAQVSADTDTFQIVNGKIASVTRSGSRLFLDFARPGDFALVISPEDLRNFRRIGVDPIAYTGQDVRVRGWVEQIRGRSEMDLATPDDLEVPGAN